MRNHAKITAMRNHVKTLEKTLEPIDSGECFFQIYDTLLKHNSGFVHNRASLLEAWKCGELYTLRIKETDALFNDPPLRTQLAIFAYPENPKSSNLNLPIFCWRGAGDACIMLWTAPHIRKLGLAKELISILGIVRACNVLPESRSFWEHLAIPETHSPTS